MLKKLPLPNYEFGKGQYAFNSKKNKFVRETKISSGGTHINWIKRLSANKKYQK